MEFTVNAHGDIGAEYEIAWRKRSRRDQDGEDRMQDAAILYLQHSGRLVDGTPVGDTLEDRAAFLTAIAYGRARTEARAIRRRQRIESAWMAQRKQTDAPRVTLRELLAGLNLPITGQRAKILTALLDGETLRGTAERVGVGVQTVRTAIKHMAAHCTMVRRQNAAMRPEPRGTEGWRAMSDRLASAARHNPADDRHVYPETTPDGTAGWRVTDGRGHRLGGHKRRAVDLCKVLSHPQGRVFIHTAE